MANLDICHINLILYVFAEGRGSAQMKSTHQEWTNSRQKDQGSKKIYGNANLGVKLATFPLCGPACLIDI